MLLQNLGIERTSVTHAALLIGATPVLIAIMAAMLRHSVARPLAWAGFALSLAGVAFIATGQGSGSTLGGDGLVLAAQLVSAGFTVSQARLLRGRDPVAVTGLQLMAAAVMVLPIAAASGLHMAGPVSGTAVLATLALVLAGTVGPTALFAFGQSRVTADVAGAFLNIEPLVGAVIGVALFADPLGPVQVGGGAAIVTGISLSTVQVMRGQRLRRATLATAGAGPAEAVQARAGAVSRSVGPVPVSVGASSPNAGATAAASVAASAPLRPPGEAPSVVRRTRLPLPVGDAGRLARALRPAGRASNRFAAGRRSLIGRRPGTGHERGSRTRRGRSRMR